MVERLPVQVQRGFRTGDSAQARVMKRDKSTGSLARGKDADLFVVDGDPLLCIGDLRHVVMTVRGGAIYPSKELYEWVGVKQ